MAVAVSHNGGLIVRCPPERVEALIEAGHAEAMVMRGRPMDGWLRVPAAGLSEPGALERWIDVALAVVRGLPPRSGRADLERRCPG